MMTHTRFTRRLGVTAVAIAATAVPGIALAAPGGPPGHPPTPAVPRCQVPQLRVGEAPAGAAAGTLYFQLELSNISSRPCTLYGYPGVSAVGPGGRQLGHAAGRDHYDATRLVVLSRGDTAHAVVEITDASFYPASRCRPADAIGLRVYPPNDFRSVIVDLPFQACRARGLVYMYVRTTMRGTGIPGFST
jgi:Protein of unknown function (DUF4232)